jgi:kynurenine formamidase
MSRVALALVAGTVLALAGCSAKSPPSALDVPVDRIVDLTYGLGPDTIFWPTAKRFELEEVAHGPTEAGFFYSAYNLCMAEHGGTHMDAPIHFAEGRITADQVPLDAGIGPAVVVDVRRQAAADRDYRLTVADLEAWEGAHGRIPAGAIVVLFSGWGARWPDAERYLGTAERGDIANLHFPGFSAEAARFLVEERNVAAVAVDTASIDHGPSTDFLVHRIVNGANKPAFENLANVDRLPPAGATIIALPLKIEGGSGAPARIIAVLPE